jgi:ABC-type Fe2+-enterobactin transport system substrate-binding protein
MCVRYRTDILWWYQICTRSGRIIGKERQAKSRYSKFEWEKVKEGKK